MQDAHHPLTIGLQWSNVLEAFVKHKSFDGNFFFFFFSRKKNLFGKRSGIVILESYVIRIIDYEIQFSMIKTRERRREKRRQLGEEQTREERVREKDSFPWRSDRHLFHVNKLNRNLIIFCIMGFNEQDRALG